MCGGCTTAIQYKSTHQLCASQSAVENGDCDCWGRAQSCDNAETDGGRWRSISWDDAGKGEWLRRGSGQVELLAKLLVAEEKRRAQKTTQMSGDVAEGGCWSRHVFGWGNSGVGIM